MIYVKGKLAINDEIIKDLNNVVLSGSMEEFSDELID